MFNRVEIKETAKDCIKGRWGSIICAMLVAGICTGIFSGILTVMELVVIGISEGELYFLVSSFTGILNAVFTYMISMGLYKYVNNFIFGEEKIEDIFSVYKIVLQGAIASILIAIATTIGGCLCVIPGIIVIYKTKFVPFILAENEGISAIDAIKESINLTNGSVVDLIVFDFSFVGWMVVGYLVCCVGVIFPIAYQLVATAILYERLKENRYNTY